MIGKTRVSKTHQQYASDITSRVNTPVDQRRKQIYNHFELQDQESEEVRSGHMQILEMPLKL
jgi:hypothetical protein